MKSRRGFIKGLAAAGPVAVAGCAVKPEGRQRPVALPSETPRHIIHLVADGMGSGIVACANHYSHLTRHRELTWLSMIRREGTNYGLMDVRSQNSIVTDSSASSSAWGCGVRIPNGKVNQSSAGTKLVTLYELLGAAGWKRGLVTTTELTHATPAGFAACTKSRNDVDEIAAQYFERRVEVLLGGGRKHFEKEARKDKRDLKGEFRKAGYAVMEKAEELKSAPVDGPLLGIFTGSHLPYVVDIEGGVTKVDAVPSLAAMTRTALKRLAREERFVLQVEGGRVDQGCHNNDAAAAIREMIAFDEALDEALEFQREHPETLVIVTTDHATGNPGLNGMGEDYGKSNQLFRNLLSIRQSVPEIAKRVLLTETPEAYAKAMFEATGYLISTRRRELLEPFLKKKGYALFEVMASDVAAVGQVLANHIGIGFTSTAHTSDLVPILSRGPGAAAFRGMIQNTDVFERYLGFAGVGFRNRQEALVAEYVPDPESAERLFEYAWA
jgi:alkaline phosphatase